MFKLDLEKAEEPEIKLPTSIGSLKNQESSRKTSTSALLTMPELVQNCLESSLRKLQLSYVDLYLIHSPTALKFSESYFTLVINVIRIEIKRHSL